MTTATPPVILRLLCRKCQALDTKTQETTPLRKHSHYIAPVRLSCRTCILKLRREKKYNPNKSDLQSMTALHHAAVAANTQALSALLEIGRVDRNQGDHLGLTPLHHAAMTGNFPAVRLLSADPATNLESQSRTGKTPLHFAAGGGYPEVTSFLLDRYTSSYPVDKKGKTPLDFAVQNAKTDTVAIFSSRPRK